MKMTKTKTLVSSGLRITCKSVGLFLFIAATCSSAYGWHRDTPELNPNSMAAAAAMLSSGFFLITGFRRRKG